MNQVSGRDWSNRARGFAAEFVVVVAGILVALIIQAAWQQHQDRDKESGYLRQLVADLTVTERSIARADSLHAPGERAQRQLIFAFQRIDAPPLDSIAVWLWQTILRSASPVPVMGTIDALIATGDMRLIQDDSLRAAILNYASSIRSDATAENRSTEEAVFNLKHEIAARVDFAELQARYYSLAQLDSIEQSGKSILLLPGQRRVRFPLNSENILNDRVLYTALIDLDRAKNNIKKARQSMLVQTASLKREVAQKTKL